MKIKTNLTYRYVMFFSFFFHIVLYRIYAHTHTYIKTTIISWTGNVQGRACSALVRVRVRRSRRMTIVSVGYAHARRPQSRVASLSGGGVEEDDGRTREYIRFGNTMGVFAEHRR